MMTSLGNKLFSLWRSADSHLSVKINTVIVAVLGLLMVVPSLILANIHTDRLMNYARGDAERMVDLFAQFCQGPLSREAYGPLVYNSKSLLENGHVLYVDIYNREGVGIVPSQRRKAPEGGDIYVVRRDVVARHIGAGYVGRVEVGFDLAPVQQDVSRLFNTLIVSILAAGALLVFALTLLLQKFVGRPIQRLVTSVKIIATGDLAYRIGGMGSDELGDLAENINIMTANLDSTMRARKEAEDSLARLNRELEQKVRDRTAQLAEKAVELEALNRHLQDLDEVKSSLLSQVSHELRTPLTSVLGFTKLIARDFNSTFTPLAANEARSAKKGQRILENLRIIEMEGERLTRLINELLDLNKIESGHMEWHDREVRLQELIEHVVKTVSCVFDVREEVALVSSVPPTLPCITADPDRIEQVLINLLNNAAKFTFEGSVAVSARVADSTFVEIRVTDTGMGIPKEEQQRIFEKFTQVRQEDEGLVLPKGTGLGLAICKEIVEHYHGSLRVESELGKGSSFIIMLPYLSS